MMKAQKLISDDIQRWGVLLGEMTGWLESLSNEKVSNVQPGSLGGSSTDDIISDQGKKILGSLRKMSGNLISVMKQRGAFSSDGIPDLFSVGKTPTSLKINIGQEIRKLLEESKGALDKEPWFEDVATRIFSTLKEVPDQSIECSINENYMELHFGPDKGAKFRLVTGKEKVKHQMVGDHLRISGRMAPLRRPTYRTEELVSLGFDLVQRELLQGIRMREDGNISVFRGGIGLIGVAIAFFVVAVLLVGAGILISEIYCDDQSDNSEVTGQSPTDEEMCGLGQKLVRLSFLAFFVGGFSGAEAGSVGRQQTIPQSLSACEALVYEAEGRIELSGAELAASKNACEG